MNCKNFAIFLFAACSIFSASAWSECKHKEVKICEYDTTTLSCRNHTWSSEASTYVNCVSAGDKACKPGSTSCLNVPLLKDCGTLITDKANDFSRTAPDGTVSLVNGDYFLLSYVSSCGTNYRCAPDKHCVIFGTVFNGQRTYPKYCCRKP